jgi:hypothetical protein
MPDVSALFTTLIQKLRSILPAEGLSPAAVAEALADDELRGLGHEILQAERKAHGATEASDSEAWDSLTASLSEALRGDSSAAPRTARTALTKRLKALAGDLQRRWIVVLPVQADVDEETGVSRLLSTAASERVVVAPANSDAQLRDRLQRAFEHFQAAPPSSLPTVGVSALFISRVVGSEDSAIRQAVGKFATGRDALRFAFHVQSGDLGPLRHEVAGSLLSDVWLVEQLGKPTSTRIVRLGDVALGATISSLADPRLRKLFDIAARVLETCPEGGKDRQDLAGRLARSIRVFARAVAESNRDLRFLLLLVAFEAVLSRKDSAIAESLSEVGALLASPDIEGRVNLARALKRAYEMRSRFVHAGQIPSERFSETELAQTEGVVFQTWVAVMRRLVTLADAALTDELLFDGLARLKFGASWAEAFTARIESKPPEATHG